jgi:hypothetical protein
VHKTAKNHASARVSIAERAIPLLKAYGDAMLDASTSEIDVLNYAKKITNSGGTGAYSYNISVSKVFECFDIFNIENFQICWQHFTNDGDGRDFS